ncbi:MAG: ATP-binding cassette domain-containing protein, partial [Anaerolineales bacterium]|nr:ATP-binding cassette domain-containing protein [Anaerolineales bacterium]
RVLEGKPRLSLKAVDGVDFHIPKGTTFALVGESGCGKSTVARLIVGLYEPTRGEVVFDGTPVSTLKRRADLMPFHRRDPAEGRGRPAPRAPRGVARLPPRRPDDLPGPLRQPEPPLAGARHRRRAPAGLQADGLDRGPERPGGRTADPGGPEPRGRRKVPPRVLGRPA